jgi:hypothetical protein
MIPQSGDFANVSAVPASNTTPSGRIPGKPLRNPRHELAAHAYVRGLTGREAGIEAGYKDGPGLKGNMARLRQTARMCERIAEIAVRSAELAEIHDGWILRDVALLTKSSLAAFFKRDETGKIVLDGKGLPALDFTAATEEQYRFLEELSYNKFGPKIKVRDPSVPLDKLMRHRGLMRDKVAVSLTIRPANEMSDDELLRIAAEGGTGAALSAQAA